MADVVPRRLELGEGDAVRLEEAFGGEFRHRRGFGPDAPKPIRFQLSNGKD
jgi:hypothetical protein